VGKVLGGEGTTRIRAHMGAKVKCNSGSVNTLPKDFTKCKESSVTLFFMKKICAGAPIGVGDGFGVALLRN